MKFSLIIANRVFLVALHRKATMNETDEPRNSRRFRAKVKTALAPSRIFLLDGRDDR